MTSRRELLDDFLAAVGAAGDAKARDRAERALRRAVRRIWGKHNWRVFVHPTPYTFDTVAGTRTYALPPWFGRVFDQDQRIRNITGGGYLRPVDPLELAARDPRQGTTAEVRGRPSCYFLAGVVGVSRQPDSSVSLALEVLSDSAADTTVRALVEGLNDAGVWTRTQVTLNGASPVALGSWSYVDRVAKSYPEGVTATTEFTTSAGNVTFRQAAGPIVLQALLPDEASVEYPLITVAPIPDAVYTLAVPVFRRPTDLRYDADVIPDGWDGVVFERARVEWALMAGELGAAGDPGVTGQAFVDLVCEDNLARPPHRHRPWRG